MKLTGIQMKSICLGKIVPMYMESVPNNTLERMVHTLEQGRHINSYAVVEKDRKKDTYWLVSGFLEYRVYCHAKERKRNIQEMPCIVQPSSSETERRIHLLSRMFECEPAGWMNKHITISRMLHDGKSTADIAAHLGVDETDIRMYFLHPDIPAEIVAEAYRHEGSCITLEHIRNARLHPFLTYKLYQKAVLPKRHPERLTADKLQKIKWLLMLDGFYELEKDDQWKLLQQAMQYRNTIEAAWSEEIKRRTRSSSIIE